MVGLQSDRFITAKSRAYAVLFTECN